MSRAARAGFTLIEVLAALLVLSASLAVITHGLVVARMTGADAASYQDAARLAAELVEGPLPSDLVQPGRLTGNRYGRAYEIVATAIDPAMLPKSDQPASATFAPLKLKISVDAGNGRQVVVDTVRLVQPKVVPQ